MGVLEEDISALQYLGKIRAWVVHRVARVARVARRPSILEIADLTLPTYL